MGEINNINWIHIWEASIPLLIILVLGWIAHVVWHNRKTICLWLKKQKFLLLPINFNIALSFDFKEGLNSGNYFDQIKKDLNKIINDSGLGGRVIIKDFSDIKRFSNKEQAESFRNKKNIDLIIWGEFTNDALKIDGQNVNKIDLHFTYSYPDNEERTVGKMLFLDVSTKLAQKNYWKIVEGNSLADVKVVSNNIFDISTYILARTLELYGRLNISLNLYEELYNSLLVRKDEFSKEILPHLCRCYEILVVEKGIKSKDFSSAIDLCEKILKIKPRDFFAISNLAVFQYKAGNHEASEKMVNKLQTLYPNNPITEADAAYFRILQKKYSSAYKHYSRLVGFDSINFPPQEVIEFLDTAYEKFKEPALLYGIGVISDRFWDKKLAKDVLNDFLQKADKIKYKLMRQEAKRILKNLKI
jgi:tetratricopeptide (TPR) repeat protein